MVVRDLWAGADVRWIGPDETRDVVHLRHGDPAVVVDAGRHQVTSFSTFHRAGQPRPRPGRGVRIRLADGPEVTVPRKHLAIVAPDHPLSPEPDPSHAAWWLEQLDEWGREGIPVSSFVPSRLEAVCQVLHPWLDFGSAPVRWRELRARPEFADAEERLQTSKGILPSVAAEAGLAARDGELDRLTAVALVDCLASATSTPNDVFVAVWGGWGDVPPQRFPSAAQLDTQSRGHFLLRGPLSGVLASVAASRSDRPAAGIWWPADRSWFAITEIDFPWTFVAGDQGLVDRLTSDERLEAVRTDFAAPANQPPEPW